MSANGCITKTTRTSRNGHVFEYFGTFGKIINNIIFPRFEFLLSEDNVYEIDRMMQNVHEKTNQLALTLKYLYITTIYNSLYFVLNDDVYSIIMTYVQTN